MLHTNPLNSFRNYLLMLPLLVGVGCTASLPYSETEHGITLTQEGITTTLTVVNPRIIHVEKQGENVVREELPDYVTILEPQDTPYEITEGDDAVTLTTEALAVTINAKGEVSFTTPEGETLTQEVGGAHSYLTPATEESPYVVSQAFTAGDEAIYGLGQYQSGLMNWKNTPVRLSQFNQEIAIPLMVSTKGYAIYWHNYSESAFNYPDKELTFDTVEDEAKNRKTVAFTPTQSGEYTFLLESPHDFNNRRGSRAMLSIDNDTIINYTTIWIPEALSGKKVLEAGRTYHVAFENTNAPHAGAIRYNAPDWNQSVFSSSYGDGVEYYFIAGEEMADVLSEYTLLTGKAPMYPKGVFGFWQCRERYNTQAELLENAHEMRRRSIPFDYIVQDWNYWPKGGKGPEWDRSRYPNPEAMVKELAEMNVKLMVSVWPSVNNVPLLTKYGIEDQWIEKTAFLDFYNPALCDTYYKMLSDSMFHIGVKSIWLDGTEPEQKPENEASTHLGDFGKVANPYSLLVNKTMYEGRRAEFPNERVFNLTRSSFAGQQRFGATSWSGDVAGTWEQFAEQIPAGLNFVMCGVPYWTTDIGGFFRDSTSENPVYDSQYTNPEYIELLTRWFQFGAFNPLFRIHGYKSQTEIWRYNRDFEAMARKFIDLRYELMPYIYSQSWQVTNKGRLMMAPLVYYYPEDSRTWGIKDQFFLGESLLVNPVTTYKARERELYLPEGEWFDFWTGEKLQGGTTLTAQAPLNSLPLYVKAGSILPLGAAVQYATEPTEQPMRLRIYPGKDAQYTLYLDDNESYDYEKGEYQEIQMSYNDAAKTLTITAGSGTIQEKHHFEVELLGGKRIIPVVCDGNPLEVKL